MYIFHIHIHRECIYISKLKKYWKLWTFVLLLLRILVHFLLLKKSMSVPLFKGPDLFFYWKYALFFHNLNVNMHMMLLACCLWILNKKNVVEKVGPIFFNKLKIFLKNILPTNLWIWTHILVLLRQLTSNFFSSYI